MFHRAARATLEMVAAGLLWCCATSAAQAATGGHNPLVGSWRLQRYVDTPDHGAPVYAFGEAPVGMFVFTSGGDVSISIMRSPPAPEKASADPDPDACIPGWYCSYFGTYTYGPAAGRWITHVLGGNIPNYIGTDQPRSFKIRGDTLIITDTYVTDGKTVHAERVLRGVRPRGVFW